MAGGGMAYTAMQTCAQGRSTSPAELPVDVGTRYEHIEITALPDENSLEVAQILQERHIASNPFKAYAKACTQQIAGREGEAPSKLKRPEAESNFFVRMLFSLFPILTWLPQLNRRTSVVLAGLPRLALCRACAGRGGLNFRFRHRPGGDTPPRGLGPQPSPVWVGSSRPGHGTIYRSARVAPTLVYALFGQSRQLAVGPVAMVSLLVQAGLDGVLTQEDCPQWCAPGGSSKPQSDVCRPQYVNLACMTAAVAGGMQIVGAILRLGFLVSFLGHPVTSGFTSGAAIIIGLSQLKDVLGYDVSKSELVHVVLQSIFSKIGQTQPLTVFLSVVFFLYLVLNKVLATRYRRLRILRPLGPLVCCVAGSLLLLAAPPLIDQFHIKHVGNIPQGIMPESVTKFRASDVEKVLPTALSVVLIGYMESIAIGKNLASQHGYEIDAGQEMLALGIANLVGSTLSCYPVTGSFSRSAVANSTGARTQLAGFVTGLLMFCTLMFLTPLFYYLPKFVLAAIVLNSVKSLVAFEEAKRLWRAKRQDFLLWVVAFFGTLFLGPLYGILVAVSLSMVIIIYESVRPQITILWRIPGTTIYRNMKQESSGAFVPNVFITRIGSSLYFANASFVKDMLLTYVSDLQDVSPTEYLVLEMTPVISIDSTACHVLHDIAADFRSRGIEVAFAMVGNLVERTMRNTQLKQFIGDKWFFATVNDAVQYCLRHQHAKKRLASRNSELEDKATSVTFDVQDIGIGCSDEFGFSNDMHSESTMVFITLSKDVPMIMSSITGIFKRSRLTVDRAQVEPLDNDGAKHVYFVRSLKSGGKLSEFEIERVRGDMQLLISSIKKPKARDAASGRADVDFAAGGLGDTFTVPTATFSVEADVDLEAMGFPFASEPPSSEVAQQRFASLESKVEDILKILRANAADTAV